MWSGSMTCSRQPRSCSGKSANTGRRIGTDLSRSVDARLVFMNGARDRIATIEETNARNEGWSSPFLKRGEFMKKSVKIGLAAAIALPILAAAAIRLFVDANRS